METILLVDDNPLRAAMRQSLLEAKAPEVVRARDAAEALCLVESPQFARDLALVITGHLMSGISGPEFVAELRSRMPQVPILVLSTVPNSDREYLGIPRVTVSHTTSPDELQRLAGDLLGMAQRRSA